MRPKCLCSTASKSGTCFSTQAEMFRKCVIFPNVSKKIPNLNSSPLPPAGVIQLFYSKSIRQKVCTADASKSATSFWTKIEMFRTCANSPSVSNKFHNLNVSPLSLPSECVPFFALSLCVKKCALQTPQSPARAFQHKVKCFKNVPISLMFQRKFQIWKCPLCLRPVWMCPLCLRPASKCVHFRRLKVRHVLFNTNSNVSKMCDFPS